jgi:hypothetical protein
MMINHSPSKFEQRNVPMLSPAVKAGDDARNCDPPFVIPNKKRPIFRLIFFLCREDRIRTCDPLVPNQVRYRAALLPETGICDLA